MNSAPRSNESVERHRFLTVRRLFPCVCILLAVALFGFWLLKQRVTAQGSVTVRQARRLLNQGHSEAARSTLKMLLFFDPDHCDALLVAGESLQQENEIEQAAILFASISRDCECHERADFLRIKTILGQARTEDAEQELRRHLKLYPKSQAAREELQWLLFNQLREREQESLLEAALKHAPGDRSILVHLLYSSQQPPMARESVRNLQRINQQEPGQPSVQLALAQCYWKLGDVDRARVLIDTVLQKRPHHLETELVAATFFLEQGEIDSAARLLDVEETADKAESRTEDDRWWWLRSQLAGERGDLEQAQDSLQEALKRRPLELKYVHRNGILLMSLGRTEQAVTAFELSKRLQASNRRLYEIVNSGAIQSLTQDLCHEIERHYVVLGKRARAAGWKAVAEQLGTASAPTLNKNS